MGEYKLGLIADPVIEAIARLEFENGLRTGWLEDRSPPWRLLVGAAATILESILNPPGVAGWSWVECGCHKVPRPNSNSAEFRAWVVLNHSSYVVLG